MMTMEEVEGEKAVDDTNHHHHGGGVQDDGGGEVPDEGQDDHHHDEGGRHHHFKYGIIHFEVQPLSGRRHLKRPPGYPDSSAPDKPGRCGPPLAGLFLPDSESERVTGIQQA